MGCGDQGCQGLESEGANKWNELGAVNGSSNGTKSLFCRPETETRSKDGVLYYGTKRATIHAFRTLHMYVPPCLAPCLKQANRAEPNQINRTTHQTPINQSIILLQPKLGIHLPRGQPIRSPASCARQGVSTHHPVRPSPQPTQAILISALPNPSSHYTHAAGGCTTGTLAPGRVGIRGSPARGRVWKRRGRVAKRLRGVRIRGRRFRCGGLTRRRGGGVR